jgi:hypothetical protein
MRVSGVIYAVATVLPLPVLRWAQQTDTRALENVVN